ncbi:hypothetical protein S100390_v1c03490 [Spiroplasma sp. NBRC 100390]|uniref:hypothetical protein n=1 Tax=unclassified Spiroplasma TaxID=2637901 RepID=UPI000892A4AD|nr:MULTISPECIES: hypothetical protein [unclassified Spiroplasma]AOX43692.1 hypothetical protein STU14_v1c03490 [Spiroplasma sp. TU-14]APE13162.1 hypothetical protein S100390_v1c03490 [Spiroplasma sp. NBRC 100390]
MASSKTVKTSKASAPKKQVVKNGVEEKWLFIKEQAVVDSTPAMKRSIDRSVGDVYTKTAADYRAKDGSAITTAITAQRLIAERLGKSTAQRKALEAKKRKEANEKLEAFGNGNPAKKATPKNNGAKKRQGKNLR